MSYKIVRYFANINIEQQIVEEGLTLEEAQEHCNDPESSSRTCTTEDGELLTHTYGPWFDGYTEE